MPRQSFLDVIGPADIGAAIAVFATAAQYIDDTVLVA
jgi:hypothetical protein